eukprot:4928799-Prymnesium_polylepis.1
MKYFFISDSVLWRKRTATRVRFTISLFHTDLRRLKSRNCEPAFRHFTTSQLQAAADDMKS